jgi:Family of unknown function (DUF6065)
MRRENRCATSVVTFRRVFTAAPSPLRGDRSALGTLPVAAYQYCEPVRVASSFGWYIFPPIDIQLIWNGVDLYHMVENEWRELKSVHLTDEFVEYWDANAPADLKGHWPPFMTRGFVPGTIQIWSGLLVSTVRDWSVVIGPPPNLLQTRHFSCFEGVVETDRFKPFPLFINLKLHVTDREILIPRDRPLFFVRPVLRKCYSESALRHAEYEGLTANDDGFGAMTEDEWSGYRRTVRKIDAPVQEYKPGQYGAQQRKRAKSEDK